jgi:hypothetical protein
VLKTILLIVSLSLVSCGEQIPDFPEVWQCGYSIKFNKFRCRNTKTKESINLRLDDPKMEGAQCLALEDYKQSESWVATIKELARKRCK